PPSDAHVPASSKATMEVRTVAFALKAVNDLSPPFKDVGGWHVLRLLEIEPAPGQAVDEVERSSRVRLLQDKRAAKEKAALDEAKATAKVEIDEGALAALATSLSAEPAPSAPPSSSTSSSASALSSSSAASVSAPASSLKSAPPTYCSSDAGCPTG